MGDLVIIGTVLILAAVAGSLLWLVWKQAGIIQSGAERQHHLTKRAFDSALAINEAERERLRMALEADKSEVLIREGRLREEARTWKNSNGHVPPIHDDTRQDGTVPINFGEGSDRITQ